LQRLLRVPPGGNRGGIGERNRRLPAHSPSSAITPMTAARIFLSGSITKRPCCVNE
jgi:hypothetical protein